MNLKQLERITVNHTHDFQVQLEGTIHTLLNKTLLDNINSCAPLDNLYIMLERISDEIEWVKMLEYKL